MYDPDYFKSVYNAKIYAKTMQNSKNFFFSEKGK